jgi:glycosyltransferase involved in cell wall biosynthesis
MISGREGTKPEISVVVPLHASVENVKVIRAMVGTASAAVEAIYVVDTMLREAMPPAEDDETIIFFENRGRGYNFKEGAQYARGDVIVFLHADTELPGGWDDAIQEALRDDQVIGGAFSLRFNPDSLFLRLVVTGSNMLIRLVGRYSGDRAIFIRAQLMQEHLDVLDVPLMEDTELSIFMRQHGETVLLPEEVVTSAATFIQHGLIHNTLRIIKCSLWYAVGGDLQDIYDYYYRR